MLENFWQRFQIAKNVPGILSQSIQEDEQLLWATIARSQDFLYTAPQLMWLQPLANLV